MAWQGLRRALRASAAIAVIALVTAPEAADARYAVRTLTQGSKGSDVKHLQRYLSKVGFRVARDGHYGRRTAVAQRRFERSVRRRRDGRSSRGEQRLVQRIARRRAADRRAERAQTTERSSGGAAAEQPPNPSGRAVLASDGRTAIPPDDAPPQVKAAIAAANRITRKPYRYGGGHGRWEDSGYDCSGAVSYALHGGGLLRAPLDSSGLARWGSRGRGSWITVYANSGHAYVVIAGLRFDTSRAGARNTTESGPRWRDRARSSSGYTARHPAGL
jgi:hypothetical protein